MIRFLQKDSRVIKGVFVAIIAVACVTMVITLVPGIFADTQVDGTNYASIRGTGLFGRLSTREITTPEVQQVAQRIMQQRKYPDAALPYIMPQAAQALIQREILMQEAARMGLRVTDADLRYELQNGPFANYIFPKGQYVGDDKYTDFVQNAFGMSKADFEKQFKDEIEINRLETLITGGVFLSDKEARDNYIQQGTKVKFEYAVLNTQDLRKTINPTDSELQTFFKQNAARYSNAVPETRKISYIAFTPDQLPGGAPQISDAELQAAYAAHTKDYSTPDQVKVRHILIKVAPGDAKADADAKQKAEDVLKQVKAGGNFAELAKKYSDDPGSKEQGGELGFIQHGTTVPEFDKEAFSLNPGQTSDLVKTQFGYHIIQTEEKQSAHTKTLAEVKDQIIPLLQNQKRMQQEQNFAASLATEAKSNGLEKTASAHHLQVVTTDYVPQAGVIGGLPDGSKLLTQAFTTKPGSAPQTVSTGEGYAVFQVVDTHAAHAPGFDEFKTHLVEDFRDQQLPQLLARKTNDLANAAKNDNDLDKAAKEFGATVKTSDLVGRDGQVPDIGQLATTAPQIFDLNAGQISGPINTGQTGLVAKMVDKQTPSADDIAKNVDQSKQTLLGQRREEAFAVFVTSLTDKYQKDGRIRMNKKSQTGMTQRLPG